MNATLRISSSDVRKELSIQDDKTESDNRIEVTLLKEIAENNLSHTVRCKSTKLRMPNGTSGGVKDR